MGTQQSLSIIIPVYNGSDYIGHLIENLHQFNGDIWNKLEIIIVDDGSKDDSLRVCQILAECYHNIHVFHKENGGIASARNVGLGHASGQYITFCDQDDEVIRGYSSFLSTLERNHCEIIISDTAKKSKGIIKQNHRITKNEICGPDKIESIFCYMLGRETMSIRTQLGQKINVPSTVWNCIYSRKLIENNNIQFISVLDYEDDWRFTTTCLLNAKRVYLSKEAYYVWVENPKSESHTRKYIYDFQQRFTEVVDWGRDELLRKHVDNKSIEKYNTLWNKRELIWGFYNACALDEEECIKEVKNIKKDISSGWQMLSYTKGESERLYLILLLCGMYKVAYKLNTKYIKRYFH